MATYPTNIPEPLVNFEVAGGDSILKTEFETNARFRKKPTTNKSIKATVVLSKVELNILKNWYNNTLNKGTLWFDTFWEIEGERESREMHFVEKYKVRTDSSTYPNYVVTFDLISKD